MTCRKARSFLREKGVVFEEVDLSRGLSIAELDALIGDRDYTHFLNPKHKLYRERKMKEKPPSRAEALRLMAQDPNLIRRPLLVKGKRVVAGFAPEEFERLARG
jgi:Spx/MgsR family transcriptional regulator